MNKKGILSTVILVFLALFLFGATLFSFLTSENKSEALAKDLQFGEVYSKEGTFFFETNNVAKTAFVKTYRDFVSDSSTSQDLDYIKNKKSINGIPEFSIVHDNYDEKFKERFVFYMNKENGEISNVNFDENGISFSKKFEESKINEDGSFSVGYVKDEIFEVKFDEVGLDSIKEIYNAKEKCKPLNEIENANCLNMELENFGVSVEKSGEKEVIILESKKDFFIDGEFVSVSFRFIE